MFYYKRQAFFRAENLPFANLDQMMKNHHYALYDALPNAGSQAIIKKLCTDFDAFWAALKDWKIHPEKYQTKPQIPRYKKAQGLKTFLIPAKPLSVKDSHVVFPKKLGINPVFSRFLANKKPMKTHWFSKNSGSYRRAVAFGLRSSMTKPKPKVI